MPSLKSNSGALVLVTGANGFTAVHLVRELLEHGYHVRGTVRNESKVGYLKHLFAKYGDKLGFAVVQDIVDDGAFDEAVQGVDAIVHVAANVGYNFKEPNEAIDPAVRGMKGLIKSVLEHGQNVKRIVYTSSGAAIVHESANPKTFSDADWNDESPAECASKGAKASPVHMYRASKTMAERAAWELFEKHKSEGKWDLVSIIPNYIFGPSLQEAPTPEALNTSMRWLFEAVVRGTRTGQDLLTGSGWIDVRDLATAHRLALEKSEAGGERLLVNCGSWFWQDWMDVANAIPSPYKSLAKGFPGTQEGLPHKLSFDASKATRILGLGSKEMPYKTKQESMKDILEDFAARGW